VSNKDHHNDNREYSKHGAITLPRMSFSGYAGHTTIFS